MTSEQGQTHLNEVDRVRFSSERSDIQRKRKRLPAQKRPDRADSLSYLDDGLEVHLARPKHAAEVLAQDVWLGLPEPGEEDGVLGVVGEEEVEQAREDGSVDGGVRLLRYRRERAKGDVRSMSRLTKGGWKERERDKQASEQDPRK